MGSSNNNNNLNQRTPIETYRKRIGENDFRKVWKSSKRQKKLNNTNTEHNIETFYSENKLYCSLLSLSAILATFYLIYVLLTYII